MSESNNTAAKGCILVIFGIAMLVVMGAAGFLVLMPSGPSGRPDNAVGPAGIDPVYTDPQPSPAGYDPNASTGPALQRIRERKTLLVAMDTGEPPWTGTPPMFFVSPEGTHDGLDMALSRRIAASVGVADVKVVHAKYGDLEALLTDPERKVDLLISGYAASDNAAISWSEPYLDYGLCLVVPANSKVKSTADLFGKPVGIFNDDAAAADVQKLVKGYTELVRLEDGYWDQLAAGKFAGFLYDYPYAQAEIKNWYAQNPSRKGTLRIAQYNLTDSHYVVGVRKVEDDLLDAVNHAIQAWKDSPEYAAALKTYLKSEDLGATEIAAGAKTVKVQAGETLSLIAKRELGSVERWTDLWEKNRDRFPNPHLIDVGDVVILP